MFALYCRFAFLFGVCSAIAFSATANASTFNSSSIAPALNQAATGGFIFPSAPSDWLLIGTGNGGFGTTVSVNSGFELGANLPTDGLVPTDDGPDVGGVTIPSNGVAPSIGIGGNGDTALTDPTGTFDFQTLDGDGMLNGTTGRSGIYGDTGVQASQGAGAATDGNSNTFFTTSTTFPIPNTLLSNSNGINGGDGATLQGLRDALDLVRTNVPLLPSGGTLTGGAFTMDLTINLTNPGIHVLDVAPNAPGSSGPDDWDLGNFDIVVDGPENSFLFVRIPEGVSMLTSNSFIGIGDGGIGESNVLFFTDQSTNNNTHFNFQNTVFNGVAFWDLSDNDGADLAVDNGQGCAHFVAEQIVMNDVRLNHCGPLPEAAINPEPASATMLMLAVAGIYGRRGRRR